MKIEFDKRQLRMFHVIGAGLSRRTTPVEHRNDVRKLLFMILIEKGYKLALLDQRRMERRRLRK